MKKSCLGSIVAVAVCLFLSACSPKYDWREVRGSDAPFVVVLPAKPAFFSRPINLDGVKVTMSMTAAEVDGTTFAVGVVELPDAAGASAALLAMKTALVQNIAGQIKAERVLASVATVSGAPDPTSIEIEAVGTRNGGKQALLLKARFVARDKRVYQLLVAGKEKSDFRDVADTFLSSFKLR